MAAKRKKDFYFQLFFKQKKKQLGKKLLLREYYDNLGGDFVKKKIFFSVTIGRSNCKIIGFIDVVKFIFTTIYIITVECEESMTKW